MRDRSTNRRLRAAKNEIGAMRVGRTWRSASSNAGMRRQPRPGDFAGEAEIVQILRAVFGDAPLQHALFPRCRRDLETLQLAHDLQYAVRAVKLGVGRDMLPAQQELVELRRRDRGDFAAQAARASGGECARECAGCTTRSRARTVFAVMALEDLALRIRACRARCERRSTSSASRSARSVAVMGPRHSIQPRTVASVSSMESLRSVATQNSRSPRSTENTRPASLQFGKPVLPFRNRGAGDEGEQRVVDLVGIARFRPDFARYFVDRGGIEDAVGHLGARRAAQLHGACAALFERRVVQIGVGIRVEDLVRKNGGRGVLDCDSCGSRRFRASRGRCFSPSTSIASCRQLRWSR